MDRPLDDRSPTAIAWVVAFLCLIVPVVLAAVAPRLVTWGAGLALYLVLVPAFVLPYLHTWRGAVTAGALGGLALYLVGFSLARHDVPWNTLLPVSLALMVVIVGAGQVTALLHRSRVEAEERALSDPGTGLPNRRHALLHLERGLAAAARGERLSVVAFDLDNFKQINDLHGHAVGDHVLATFARILGDRIRKMNLSARMGGDEFLSVLENTGLEGAVTFAEDVRKAVQVTAFRFGSVTVSAGVASHEPGMASPETLLSAVDRALYRAKLRGRNQVAVAGPIPSQGRHGPIDFERHPERSGDGERLLLGDRDEDTRQAYTGHDRAESCDSTCSPSAIPAPDGRPHPGGWPVRYQELSVGRSDPDVEDGRVAEAADGDG